MQVMYLKGLKYIYQFNIFLYMFLGVMAMSILVMVRGRRGGRGGRQQAQREGVILILPKDGKDRSRGIGKQGKRVGAAGAEGRAAGHMAWQQGQRSGQTGRKAG